MSDFHFAVLFDLDGVLTDTAELHYQSWKVLADELGIPFDRRANEALRGVSRQHSLRLVLGERAGTFSAQQQAELLRRKNEDYISRLAAMSPDDLLPGVDDLLDDLKRRRAGIAVASSSRNARRVIDQLRLGDRLDVIVDGNDAPQSKPDPELFLLAAERIRVPRERCVVVEDAESGVEAARRGGLKVVGVGPRERVGAADVVVARPADLTGELLERLATGAA